MSRAVRVAAFAAACRVGVLALMIAFDASFDDLDTSAHLQNRPCDRACAASAPGRDAAACDGPGAPSTFLDGLAPWDSVFFSRIARCGYETDMSYAFFPLVPMAMRLGGSLFPWLPPGSREALAGLLLSLACTVAAAVALYELTLSVLNDDLVAICSAVLFALNPAGAFYAAAYTEAPFAALSWWGAVWLRGEQPGWGVLALALASATRSNGLLACWYAVHPAIVAVARERIKRTAAAAGAGTATGTGAALGAPAPGAAQGAARAQAALGAPAQGDRSPAFASPVGGGVYQQRSHGATYHVAAHLPGEAPPFGSPGALAASPLPAPPGAGGHFAAPPPPAGRLRASGATALAAATFVALAVPYVAMQRKGFAAFCAPRADPAATGGLTVPLTGPAADLAEARANPRGRPAWCDASLFPSIYSHAQRRYWDVGFLRYYEHLNRLPKILEAAPILGLSVLGCWAWASHDWPRALSLGVVPGRGPPGRGRSGRTPPPSTRGRARAPRGGGLADADRSWLPLEAFAKIAALARRPFARGGAADGASSASARRARRKAGGGPGGGPGGAVGELIPHFSGAGSPALAAADLVQPTSLSTSLSGPISASALSSTSHATHPSARTLHATQSHAQGGGGGGLAPLSPRAPAPAGAGAGAGPGPGAGAGSDMGAGAGAGAGMGAGMGAPGDHPPSPRARARPRRARMPLRAFLSCDAAAPFVHHWALMTAVSALFMHVHVATRFLSACAPLYWYGSGLVLTRPRLAGWWAFWAVSFTLVGSLLFPNFYPWT